MHDRRCDGPYNGWDDSTESWVATFHECCESPESTVAVKVRVYELENGNEQGEFKHEYWEAD